MKKGKAGVVGTTVWGELTEAGRVVPGGLAEEAVHLLHLLQRRAREDTAGFGENLADLLAELGDNLRRGGEVVEAAPTPLASIFYRAASQRAVPSSSSERTGPLTRS